MSEKTNWEILSFTRFLMALVVMVGHLQAHTEIGFLKTYTYLGSFEAILGFLLISGLSIGKSIAKNKEDYFKRRVQRIYPVYLASIALKMTLVWSTLNVNAVFLILLNIVFLNQVVTDTSFVGPAWTLAAEVWLYCLAPVFLKLSRKTLYALVICSFVCYAVYTCGRSLFQWPYYSGTQYGINLFLLAYVWIAGFTMAIFPSEKINNSRLVAVLFIGHLALTTGIQLLFRIKNNQFTEIVNIDLPVYLGHAVCLVFVYYVVIYNHKIPLFKPFTNKLFNLLGNMSYPLYLTHTTSFYLLGKAGVNNVAVMIAAALTVSFLIYYLFDFYSKKRSVDKKPYYVSALTN